MRQFLIDFCERRENAAVAMCNLRAIKYGDKSIPWKIAIYQEIFWGKISNWILKLGK